MDKITFGTDIESVSDLQNDETSSDLVAELSRIGISVERQRVNRSGSKAKTLTPSWYKNKPIKNYAYNFGDSMLHIFVDKKTGVLIRLELEDILIVDNKKGIKTTLRKLALDIEHAHRAMTQEKDKTNSIKMGISSEKLEQILSEDTRVSVTDENRTILLKSQIKALTKGSGKYIVSNKESDAFLSTVAKGSGNKAKGFTKEKEFIRVFDTLEDAKLEAQLDANAYYVFKI